MSMASGNASEGWTLHHALERTADPKAWSAWVERNGAFDKVRQPIPSAPAPAPKVVAEHRQAAVGAYNDLIRQFRDMLVSGVLVATGSRNARSRYRRSSIPKGGVA